MSLTSGGGEVKLTVVMKKLAREMPVVEYNELAQETNLNSPPSNWLRGSGAAPWIPGPSTKREFSSFEMANNNLDYVGKVDIISDAEHIKKLLKASYLEESVSLLVNRIGKTLFIDSFDIFNHFLRVQEEDWQWLGKFIAETISEGKQLMPVAARKEIEEKLMLSKFLYHSVQSMGAREVSASMPAPEALTLIPDPLEDEREAMMGSSDRYERNCLWTFEDLCMLVGTNLPIFGCGTHPCVTLKLRDMKKPINVLTGLDYWLDNLMCNVPEVVMCYHLIGIVQKYEIIPTDKLPSLEGSQFSPELVRDVAQNILSFLKNNATKEGHTYWLFKGEDDEVVKLYDLSSICDKLVGPASPDSNPFTLPVAVLMYRVARNLMQQGENRPRRKANAIYRLLNNCLQLLTKDIYPQVVGSVHYLLANLYLSYGTSGNPKCDLNKSLDGADDSADDWAMEEAWESADADDSSCISVEVLKRGSLELKANLVSKTTTGTRRPLPNCTNLDDCCKQALEHIYEGLECTDVFLRDHQRCNDTSSLDGTPDPLAPIPLKYEPLKKADAKILPPAVRRPLFSPWQTDLTALLLVQAATAYRLLAECSLTLARPGRSLRFIKLGFICLEGVKGLAKSTNSPSRTLVRCRDVSRELAAGFLSHAGDTFLALWRATGEDRALNHMELNSHLHFRDQVIVDRAKKIIGSYNEATYFPPEYGWASLRIPDGPLETLLLAQRCYLEARKEMQALEKAQIASRYLKFMTALRLDSVVITRSLGNVHNELGSFYTNLVKEFVTNGELGKWAQDLDYPEGADKGEFLVDEGLRAFQQGISNFRAAGDRPNQALLCSNSGRLLRLRSHLASIGHEEFTSKERQFFSQALELYQKGLETAGVEDSENVWEMVTAELASTFFTFAIQLQERPPLSTDTKDEIEKDITDLMQKSLRQYELLSETRKDSPLSSYSQIRCFEIHYRLASLYHKLYRDKEDPSGRKAKLLRTLTELHYRKAAEIYRKLFESSQTFRSIVRSCEFLRLQLERVAFYEGLIAVSSSPSAKQKLCDEILSALCSECHDLDYLSKEAAKWSSEEEERWSEELVALTKLFLERVQIATKTCLQLSLNLLRKTPTAKVKEQNERWKKAYKTSLLEPPGDLSDFCAALHKMCFVMQKV